MKSAGFDIHYHSVTPLHAHTLELGPKQTLDALSPRWYEIHEVDPLKLAKMCLSGPMKASSNLVFL